MTHTLAQIADKERDRAYRCGEGWLAWSDALCRGARSITQGFRDLDDATEFCDGLYPDTSLFTVYGHEFGQDTLRQGIRLLRGTPCPM